MRAFRVAIAGAGFFSRFQIEGWQAIPGVQVVGNANRHLDKAQEVARRHGIVYASADAAAMLDAVKPDLLDVITSPPAHRTLVDLAIERRIPVICQKPFGTTYGEAVAMVEAAEAARVPLVVHENFRFEPWWREVRRLVDEGRLGTLHSIAFRMRPGDGQGPRAYLDRQPYFQAMPRFLIVETGIHFIDSFRFLMGEVEAVTARLRRMNPAVAGEDAGYVIFEFERGATGLLDANRCNDHPAANPWRTLGQLWFEGSGGVLRMDGDARLWWKPHGGAEVAHTYDMGRADAFGGGACEWLQRHVVAHLLQGAPVENAARDYLANLRVQEAVYVSHREGRRVALAGFVPPEGVATQSPIPPGERA
jgi:predicted dehydrogenase